MKISNPTFNPEISSVTEERRKKIIWFTHSMCFCIFLTHILMDSFYQDFQIIPLTLMMLLLIVVSFFVFYRQGKYDYASYVILIILTIEIIASMFIYHFDHYTPAFIFPFILGAFSLFSWKRGLILSLTFLLIVVLLLFYYQDVWSTSTFLHNSVAISNFLSILVVIFVFAIYYETTRIDAYKRLINSNYKKDLLYNEIHHRVKNNLNIVSSMLAIQAEQEDKKTQNILKVSKDRIDAIALVHSMLYVSNDMEKVNAKLFIEKLALNIQSTLDTHVSIIFKIKEVELSLNEIIPLGLIINELLTNSFKYAFMHTQNPKIIIVLHIRKNKVTLTYHDNGVGCRKAKCEQGLGLKLVDLNVKQLKGTLKRNHNYGLSYKIIYQRSLHV